MATNGRGGDLGFESTLWDTADKFRIRIDPAQSEEVQAAGIPEAVREVRRTYPAARVFIVFSYSTYDVGGLADGRGFGSVDNPGLNGAGDGLIGRDQEGKIKVEVNGKVYPFDWD